MDEDERASSLARVKQTLEFLPGGVPQGLWNYNSDQLAELIVDGEKRFAPSGMQLVKIDGRWYYNDPGDLVTYLKEYVE